MLRIRLRREGNKKKPSYRLVVADQRAARNGSFVDYLGYYDPKTDPPTIEIDKAKAEKWLSDGASPTKTVKSILDKVLSFDESVKIDDSQGSQDSKDSQDSTKG